MILDHTPNLPNVRLTSEARPASAGWREACWLNGIFGFLITFFPFLDACSLLDTEALQAS
jgi:hypothetical protein